MQQAITYSNGVRWLDGGHNATIADRPSPEGLSAESSAATSTSSSSYGTTGGGGGIRSLVLENPVLVLGRRGCFMCHVVNKLLQGLGVNPTVCELDEDSELETALLEELIGLMPSDRTSRAQLPAVFIGGKHVGGLERLMASHISGDLVPTLKEAGALWL